MRTDMATTDYIGTGFAYPMGVNGRGGISLSSGLTKIEQTVRLVLSTALTERVMRPEFGCGIWDHVFDPITPSNLSEMAGAVKQALARWEPRIKVIEVVAAPHPTEPTHVLIDLMYEVSATNERHNLVYPFYVLPSEETS